MNEKILIVDDQFGIRILLNEVLQKEGYQTFQEAKDLGALTHFAKPFDIDDIRQAVKQYIPA
ncbi:hypothetical protein ACQCVM_17000 [Rossellomorea aquimaris]|uniref:hypothetical protein n=1 Tax=Rossellomorea aquimaris TaxID=189382 RepID=UPI003CF1F565